jgi:fibronectin type 3 domain-containing protein
VDVSAKGPGMLKPEIPLESDWIGKEVTVAVRATGPKGKTSDWSNLRQLTVAPPLMIPADLKAGNAPLGVAVSWRGTGPHYHVFRGIGDAPPDLLTDTDNAQILDTPIEYGTPYTYYVQAFNGELQQSEVAGPVQISPEDVFAPSVPGGLTAEQGTNAIELSWERNTEARFQGYNLFRSVEGGPFEKVGSLIAAPTYSDHDVQPGKKYRYQVSAVATNGKESDRSTTIEITAQ